MILVIIICGILYLFMIYGVIYLYYTYHKEYEELEKRLLVNEKRFIDDFKNIQRQITNIYDLIFEIEDKKNIPSKEGDNMACKKGRGGRKK